MWDRVLFPWPHMYLFSLNKSPQYGLKKNVAATFLSYCISLSILKTFRVVYDYCSNAYYIFFHLLIFTIFYLRTPLSLLH